MQKGMRLDIVSWSVMDVPSVGDLQMKTVLFSKKCCTVDKIEGSDAENAV